MTSAQPDITEWGFPNRTTPVGSAAYYAVRFSPQPFRQRNALLLTWYELIQTIAQRPTDSGAARLKLDWWREEVGRLAHGQARHPLAKQLYEVGVAERAAPTMTAVIDMAEGEVRTPALNSDSEFANACRRSHGNFFVLLTRVERKSDYNDQECLELGAYCAAVERIRRLAECPHRVPVDLSAQSLAQLSRVQRAGRIEALLRQFDNATPLETRKVPDFARRLTAQAEAMHHKMRRKGYPVADTLIDRAPIAHLWTAWRCR